MVRTLRSVGSEPRATRTRSHEQYVVKPIPRAGQTPVAPAVGAAMRGSHATRQDSLSARTFVRIAVFGAPFLERSGF